MSPNQNICVIKLRQTQSTTIEQTINFYYASVNPSLNHVLIPGVGHLKFYRLPGIGHLPTPRTTLGHLTPFLARKAIPVDHFHKNLLRFCPFVKYKSCIFSSSIT